MKAVLCKAFGPPESLVLEDVPEPSVGPKDVLIDIRAVALNFPDLLMIEGKYQMRPSFPFSPGAEVSGTVIETGAEVSGFAPGDRVFGGTSFGGFAERIALDSGRIHKIPDSMNFVQTSGINTTYGTSYYALKQRAALQPGENLLVLGAAGGVGIAAVQLGKAMGARVIAAASSAEKLAAAKASGADETIDYSDGELKEKVKALTNGKGADVIYDPVGGALFDQCMRCINWYGRVLVIGFAAGDIPKVPINLILLKSCQVVGVFYGAWTMRSPADCAKNFQEILDLFEAGKAKPVVGRTFPLADYVDALRELSQRRAIGKVVMTVGDEGTA